MLKVERDKLILSTGRIIQVEADAAFVGGLVPCEDGRLGVARIRDTYVGHLEHLSPLEKAEVAHYMIRMWSRWGMSLPVYADPQCMEEL